MTGVGDGDRRHHVRRDDGASAVMTPDGALNAQPGVRGDGAGGRDDAGADGALALAARRAPPPRAPGPQGH